MMIVLANDRVDTVRRILVIIQKLQGIIDNKIQYWQGM